jgi:5-methylthioribose kinase
MAISAPRNTLVYRGKLILLDHEVVHFGDPAFDVGFAMTHFLSKANHVREHRHELVAAAKLFWQTYWRDIAPLGWEGLERRAVRHTLGCLLARVAGKSPLEYLSWEEIERQRNAVLDLLPKSPASAAELIDEFVERIDLHA